MIIGVTHDQDGRVVQRLSVSTKVSIGLPPNGDRNHPTKLDHFVFLRKKKSANRVEWETDPELTEHYGDECRELHVMLIDDDIENVFPSSYAWRTATERKCWGDGATPGSAPSNSPAETPAPGNGTRVSGGNGFAKPRACATPSSPAPNNGNGSAASSAFNQLRNEFLTAARRVATTKKQAIGEVVEWASGGVFKYGDVGRMTEGNAPNLRAATELMASALAGAAR